MFVLIDFHIPLTQLRQICEERQFRGRYIEKSESYFGMNIRSMRLKEIKNHIHCVILSFGAGIKDKYTYFFYIKTPFLI